MAKRVLIEVTQEDIDHGIAVSSCRRPLARAAARAGIPRPVVDGDGAIAFYTARQWSDLVLPKKVAIWHERLMNDKPVKPFSFYARGDW